MLERSLRTHGVTAAAPQGPTGGHRLRPASVFPPSNSATPLLAFHYRPPRTVANQQACKPFDTNHRTPSHPSVGHSGVIRTSGGDQNETARCRSADPDFAPHESVATPQIQRRVARYAWLATDCLAPAQAVLPLA